MAFLIILLALLISRVAGSLEELRLFGWFTGFSDRMRATRLTAESWQGMAGVALVVGIPVVVVLFIAGLLGWLTPGLSAVFGLLVMLYTLGPRDLEGEVQAFLAAKERGDERAALGYAEQLLGDDVPDEPIPLARSVIETLLVEFNERLVAPAFWFVVLGPAGALLYRLSSVTHHRYAAEGESGFAGGAARLHRMLAWIPARICAFAFAVAGSYVDAMQYWREEAGKWRDSSRGVLVAAGIGALRRRPRPASEEEMWETAAGDIRDALSLVRRAAAGLMIFLGAFTVVSWIAQWAAGWVSWLFF